MHYNYGIGVRMGEIHFVEFGLISAIPFSTVEPCDVNEEFV